MTDDHRAVLEAIVYGDDPRVTPSDRLRALEHLARMEDGQAPNVGYSSELAALEGEELDRHLDALLSEQIAADIFGEARRWPVLAQLVQREVDGRARTLAKELHVAQVEAEVERRVEERLCQLASAHPDGESEERQPVAQDSTVVGGLAGWPSGRSRLRSESLFRQRPRAA
jgi:hypothetical protein